MRPLILSLVSILLATAAVAQTPAPQPTRLEGRIMVIYDSSGSMWGEVGGPGRTERKYAVARREVGRLIDELSRAEVEIELGLMAYGHRRERDCRDIETLVAAGSLRDPAHRARLVGEVERIRPTGTTPIAASLEAAAAALDHAKERAIVILVSDGIEECGGDICAAARSLEQSGADFTTHVVAFDLGAREVEALRCVADETGGELLAANDAAGLARVLEELAQQLMPGWAVFTLAVAGFDEPVPAPPSGARVKVVPLAGSGEKWAAFSGERATAELTRGDYAAELDLGRGPPQRVELRIAPGEEQHVPFNLAPSRLELSTMIEPAALYADQPTRPVELRVERVGGAGEVIVEASEGRLAQAMLPGVYRVSARYAGALQEATVELGLEAEEQLQFVFAPARLVARLVGPEERAIEDPVVRWRIEPLDPAAEPIELTGRALTTTLPPGRYQITASLGPVSTNSEQVTLASGQTADAILRLPLLPE